MQKELKEPAPVYFPVSRQQDFPMSRQTACAIMQNLLQHPNASTPVSGRFGSLWAQARAARARSGSLG